MWGEVVIENNFGRNIDKYKYNSILESKLNVQSDIIVLMEVIGQPRYCS
jgi:hypothetical protein